MSQRRASAAKPPAAVGVGDDQEKRRGDQHADRVADPEAQPAGKDFLERADCVQHADESGGDERGPRNHDRDEKRELPQRVQAGLRPQQPAQRLCDGGVAHGQDERREHAHAERHVANDDVGDEDGREHHRRVTHPPNSIQTMASAGCGFHGVMLNGPSG